jgi:hypothetical protein
MFIIAGIPVRYLPMFILPLWTIHAKQPRPVMKATARGKAALLPLTGPFSMKTHVPVFRTFLRHPLKPLSNKESFFKLGVPSY